MKQHKMSQLIHKRCKKINGAIQSMNKQFDADAIHLFRVEVKKLKALLHLFSCAKGAREIKKIPGKLARCYQLAGRIRTYQLQAQAVTQREPGAGMEAVTAYITLLEAHGQHLTQLIRKQVSAHWPNNLEKRLLSRLPRRLTQKDIGRFAHKTVQALSDQQATGALSENRLHQVRKGLKDLQYVLPVLNKRTARDILEAASLTPESIEAFNKIIGQYLDTTIQVQIIHSDGNLQAPGGESYAFMHTLENKWLTERRALHQQLYNLLKGNSTPH